MAVVAHSHAYSSVQTPHRMARIVVVDQLEGTTMKAIAAALSIISVLVTCPALADSDKDESRKRRAGYERDRYEAPNHRGNEYKEEYREGNCKIERKWERNGSYKEERKCDDRTNDERAERKEEFWDGNCKVERKWEKDGDYKEERKCSSR